MRKCIAVIFCLILPLHCFSKNTLSICAIFQNEEPYLKEWIEFHKLQGVEHFYLYNNNSTDEYMKVLNPYITSKEVTLVHWLFSFKKGKIHNWGAIQRGAYDHCLKKYGSECNWIAFIDIDEFLFCPSGELLPSFLKNYETYGGVCVNWLMFGTSGVDKVPSNTLLVEKLISCAEIENPTNKHIKTIVQPQYTQKSLSAHDFKFVKKKFAISSDRQVCQGPFSKAINVENIRINHYWTRDENYLHNYKIPSRQYRRAREGVEELLKDAESYNKIQDTAILQFVTPLRKRMNFDK